MVELGAELASVKRAVDALDIRTSTCPSRTAMRSVSTGARWSVVPVKVVSVAVGGDIRRDQTVAHRTGD